MPGRPPDPNAIRRNKRVGPLQLPAGGRPGPAPIWPIDAIDNGETRQLWSDLWKTPQAVAWERLGWTRIVARYVLYVLQAEQPGAVAGVLNECRQLEDRLGLTPKAMRLLMWEIVTDEVSERRAERQELNSSVRSRIRAVDSAI